MNFNMKIANLLAKNINEFIQFVKDHEKKSYFILNQNKVYQVRLFIDEFKFQLLVDELKRINQFTWNESYSLLLVDRFQKGLDVIDEYIERNYDDLFIFTARLETLKRISSLLRNGE